MTQDAIPNDVVTQVQQEMDQEQGTSGESQPITMDQMRGMMETQARSYQSQISGLQSRIDRGLDAIRRDAQGWAAQQIGDLETRLGRDTFLKGLDSELRPLAETLLNEMDRRTKGTQQVPAEPAPRGGNPTETDSQWEQVYQIVEGMGLKRDDPLVNYAVLTETSLSAQDRQGQFMGSLREAVLKSEGGASPPRPTAKPGPVPPASQVANPPVDRGGGRGTGPVYRNADDVRDAFIMGKFNSSEDPSGINEYKRLMANLGFPV